MNESPRGSGEDGPEAEHERIDVGDVSAEPGLVVEDDVELDLGDDDDVESVGQHDGQADEDEPVADESATAEHEAFLDDDVEPGGQSAEDLPAPDDHREDAPVDAPVDAPTHADESPVFATGFGAMFADDPPHDDPPHDDPPPSDTGPAEPGRGRHWGRRALLGVLGVAAALYVAGYFLTGSRLPADASIGGVDVGGMSPSAARAAVDTALTPKVDDDIVLTHGGKQFHVKPASAGLALDLDRSIDEAGGTRSWNPSDMVGLFFGSHATAPALDVEETKLQSSIATIGESVDRVVIEPQITFPKNKPEARQPAAGLVVAKADAAKAIRAAYLVSDKPVPVPTALVEPTVDAEELAAVMRSFAEPAVSGPVTLVVGDKKVDLPVSAYAPALVVQVKNDKLEPSIDAKKLAAPLTSSTTGIGKKAVDASVKIQNNKPVIVPGKEGVGLQPAEMATKLVPVLSKTGADRSVRITAKVVEPAVTTADAKALQIRTRISSFVTTFPYAPYRNINQGRAADIMNGTIIKPGGTFSFNDIVGERTEANGFTVGTVINGGVFREELGGGVSQVATTTYNAAFFGGMDDTEHHPHAFYISRYPVGREATVYFGSLDLRWKNPTKYGVLVRSYVVKSTPSSAGQMHVELWSTKVWDVKAGLSAKSNPRSPGTQYDETDKCVPQGPIPGFNVDVYRYFYRPGSSARVRTETDRATYQAADHVICGKKPTPNDG